MRLSRSDRWAIVVKLVDEMLQRTRGTTWLGRTHIQKAAYFLQSFWRVDLGFDFVIYQYGPYSFELDSDVADLVAIAALRMEFVAGYPDYSLGPNAENVKARAASPESQSVASAVTAVAGEIAFLKAKELELLATIAYVRNSYPKVPEARVVELVGRLKPHFSAEEVKANIVALDNMIGRARAG